MEALDKIEMILSERGDSWAARFSVHSDTFSNFIDTLNQDILAFELEMRRRGKEPDLSRVRRLLSNLQKANKEVRKVLVTVARAEGLN